MWAVSSSGSIHAEGHISCGKHCGGHQIEFCTTPAVEYFFIYTYCSTCACGIIWWWASNRILHTNASNGVTDLVVQSLHWRQYVCVWQCVCVCVDLFVYTYVYKCSVVSKSLDQLPDTCIVLFLHTCKSIHISVPAANYWEFPWGWHYPTWREWTLLCELRACAHLCISIVNQVCNKLFWLCISCTVSGSYLWLEWGFLRDCPVHSSTGHYSPCNAAAIRSSNRS